MNEELNGNAGAQETADVVLCGANSYEEKYYFNERFKALPQAVKDELKIMCVLFTEDCGIARRVGARRAVIHGWGLPDSDAVFPRTLFRIARLAEIARREGVELLAENCV